MYYVYILKNSATGTLYKGYTSDIQRRIKEHQQHSTRTTAQGPGTYELVWYCMFKTKTQAIQFEKYLKSGSGRAFAKKRLI